MRIISKRGSTNTIIIGIIWIAIVLWIFTSNFNNSLEELALMQRGKTAPGAIIETWEDVEDSDSGRQIWYHGATYIFKLPDGQILHQNTGQSSGRLKPEFRNLKYPFPIQVEYLPDKPNISRIKGTEQPKVENWIIRKGGLSFLFLIVFISPGIAILISGVKERKDEQFNKMVLDISKS